MRSKFLLAVCLCLCLVACNQGALVADDLIAAQEAITVRNWPLAERLLRRCLRDDNSPERRWEAWNMLLLSTNAHGGEFQASLECLDAMLEEFADNDDKTKSILERMGAITEEIHRYGRAADVWSAYIGLSNLSSEEIVQGYRRLAATQFSLRRFDAGEDILQHCLALSLPDHDKIRCMYDLADHNIARQHWQEAADLSLQILDSEPDDELAGLTYYVLADALEQLGKVEDAVKQFELARNSYPNPAVIDKRIAQLRKKRKK